eukprot:Selendium_serpulae@DN6388_c0_g1_i5.p1
MLFANLTFSMALKPKAAQLLRCYEWLSSLDCYWWLRQLESKPHLWDSLRVACDTAPKPHDWAGSTRFPMRRDDSLGLSRPWPRMSVANVGEKRISTMSQVAMPEATHVALTKPKTRDIRRMRDRQANRGKSQNYFSLEYIRYRPLQVCLDGQGSLVSSEKVASVLAGYLFTQMLNFQRMIETTTSRENPEPEIIAPEPKFKNPMLRLRTMFFLLVAVLDSSLSILIWSIINIILFMQNTWNLVFIDPKPQQIYQTMFVFFVILAARANVLDVAMLFANLTFSMALKPKAAQLLRCYEWLSSLDCYWWKRQLENKPHLWDSLRVACDTAPKPHDWAGSTRFPMRRDDSLGLSRPWPRMSVANVGEKRISTMSQVAMPEATHVALTKPKTRDIRRMRDRQANRGKSQNYFSLEYIRYRPLQVCLDGQGSLVSSEKVASVLAGYLFTQMLKFQRMIETTISRDNPEPEIIAQDPKSKNPRFRRKTKNQRNQPEQAKGQAADESAAALPAASAAVPSVNPTTAAVVKRVRARENKVTSRTINIMLGWTEGPEFMKQVNLAGNGKLSPQELQKYVSQSYCEREGLLSSREAREGIALMFRVLISGGLWIVAVFLLLLVLGFTFQTILLTGLAMLASITVVLGVLYTNFFKSAIFILLHDPYGVGDRVRINGAPVVTVKHIRAYTTQFETVLGKPVVYPNAFLADSVIVNDSRNQQADLTIAFDIEASTSRDLMNKIYAALKRYINSRPKEWVKDSLFHLVAQAQPKATKTVELWITHVDSHHNWKAISESKTSLWDFIIDLCDGLGIDYCLPSQPVRIVADRAIMGLCSPEVYSTGRSADASHSSRQLPRVTPSRGSNG